MAIVLLLVGLAVGGIWLLDLLFSGGVSLVCRLGKVGKGTRVFLQLMANGVLVFFALLPEATPEVSWRTHLVTGAFLAFTVFLAVRSVRRTLAEPSPSEAHTS